MKMRVAIFDFDGTVYEKETYQIMMDHLKRHPRYHKRYKAFFRAILPPYIGHKMKIYPRDKMRARSMMLYLHALEDFTVEELDLFFEEIANKMGKDFNSEVISRLHEHAADGYRILLVSGAFTPLLHYATKGLPFDQVIGTNIPLHNRILSTQTPLHHVQGEKKNEQIKIALGDEVIDWENSYAYADSFSDLPVLELVGKPIAVHPDQKLKSIAQKRQWEII